MTKPERARFDKLIERQRILRNRVRGDNRPFEDMTPTEQRSFDQDYGECLGIEYAFSMFGIDFWSVDD